MNKINQEDCGKRGTYSLFVKRILDFCIAVLGIAVLSPVFVILIITGAFAMSGNPFFVQPRPGIIDRRTGREKIFHLIKFRTMNNKTDSNGKLLPDAERLNSYGKFLRKTSLDELPQLFNVICGTYALVGPRPMLVRDMVFMSDEVRQRHTVSPGITGLAQVNGRNSISWEEKFRFDLEYINSDITFWGDLKILSKTLIQVFKPNDVNREGTVSDLDYGDWLLMNGKITEDEYQIKQIEALDILKNK